MNQSVSVAIWKGRVSQKCIVYIQGLRTNRQSIEGLVVKYYTNQQYAVTVTTRMMKLKLF